MYMSTISRIKGNFHMDDETRAKFDAQNNLLGKVKVLLEDAKEPEVLYNKLDQNVEEVQDTALVQCFYGTDVARIRATMQAIEFNLQMTRKPRTWVFVEAQRRKSDCAFSWLSKYGVNYIFVKTTSENDGIMLKNPLWNIGALYCPEAKLLFLDSDVVMCNSDWVEKCSVALDGKDVISLASHQYAQADEKCSLHETIGYKWETSGTVENSHCGYTIGMTRKTFKEIGGLEPALILDDLRTFHKLVGDDIFKPFGKWSASFKLSHNHKLGYNVQLGYADNIACHVWHGDDKGKYENVTNLLVESGVDDIDDIIKYDFSKPNELPTWIVDKTRPIAIKSVLANCSGEDMGQKFPKEMRKLLGQPDEKHPLFVCTIVKDAFGLKMEDFVEFKTKVESKFNPGIDKCNPTMVFFTDCNRFDFKEAGINSVSINMLGKGTDEVEKCASSKAFQKYKHSTVMYVPFNFSNWEELNLSVWVPDEKIGFFDGTAMKQI